LFYNKFGVLLTNLEDIISQLEREKTAIDSALSALREISGMGSNAGVSQPTGQKRRGRPPKNPSAVVAVSERGSGITPEGRKRLAESMRKRWAAKKAAEKKASRGR
jgi:hypothetical protein